MDQHHAAERPLVFISHSSKDPEADAVARALEDRGIGCWISGRDIRPGANYQDAIVAALGRARGLVLVFSDNANRSGEVLKELALAGMRRLPVAPLRLDDTEPSRAIVYEIATRRWVDARSGWYAAMDRLAEQIHRW